MKNDSSNFILTLTCPDQKGIVHSISGSIVAANGNIIDSAQFGDPATNLFCMRIHFTISGGEGSSNQFRDRMTEVAGRFSMKWHLHDCSCVPRVLILVSRFDHCLSDLLYRMRIGDLGIEVPAVVSNHRDTYQLVAAHNIPFHYLPVTSVEKKAHEARLLEIVEEEKIDFIVLARYMQILSEDLCNKLAGRVINIHHSFLPGFKGARPYHQAHDRGVKLIGATAHYATSDLDEGPIIEQDVARVTHSQSPTHLAAVGRDIEQQVLARAVRYQVEHRIILNGKKTIVFI